MNFIYRFLAFFLLCFILGCNENQDNQQEVFKEASLVYPTDGMNCQTIDQGITFDWKSNSSNTSIDYTLKLYTDYPNMDSVLSYQTSVSEFTVQQDIEHNKIYAWEVVSKNTSGSEKISDLNLFSSISLQEDIDVSYKLIAPSPQTGTLVNSNGQTYQMLELDWQIQDASGQNMSFDNQTQPIYYNIYMGDSKDNLELVNSTYGPGLSTSVMSEQTYFWRVAYQTEHGLRFSPIWVFTVN